MTNNIVHMLITLSLVETWGPTKSHKSNATTFSVMIRARPVIRGHLVRARQCGCTFPSSATILFFRPTAALARQLNNAAWPYGSIPLFLSVCDRLAGCDRP